MKIKVKQEKNCFQKWQWKLPKKILAGTPLSFESDPGSFIHRQRVRSTTLPRMLSPGFCPTEVVNPRRCQGSVSNQNC